MNKKYDNTNLLIPQSAIVKIGDIPLGGDFPVRIQSMTNTNTMDTDATVAQCVRLIDAGCDFVRIAAPSIKEAENLAIIKKILKNKGYNAPIIADIHFRPLVAETAARLVEKIRINPGNYTDKNIKIPDKISDNEYENHLDIMRGKVATLISICKEYGTVIRIGVNHGSLSERIVKRYGNTVEGMVESALEFIRVCESFNFKNIVLSMKSSNVFTMIQSTRLLMRRMIDSGSIYPLHLGVTEAGDSEEGISKSAVGCGALLSDGIGDTIRVSLTGDPIIEVPVAKDIAAFYNCIRSLKPKQINNSDSYSYLTKNIKNSNSSKVKEITGTTYPLILNYNDSKTEVNEILKNSGFLFNEKDKKWEKSDISPDYIYLNNLNNTNLNCDNQNLFKNKILVTNNIRYINFFENNLTDKTNYNIRIQHVNINQVFSQNELKCLNNSNSPLFAEIDEIADEKDFQIKISLTLGKLLIDNVIDGLIVNILSNGDKNNLLSSVFNVLQASRKRFNKIEYISCPTCGRTNYDVAGTLKKIKSKIKKNKNIKNLKIAVMGCVVNGPGEMADADYGYVGAAKGKVNIYKKGEIVFKNIDEKEAINKLIDLILKA